MGGPLPCRRRRRWKLPPPPAVRPTMAISAIILARSLARRLAVPPFQLLAGSRTLPRCFARIAMEDGFFFSDLPLPSRPRRRQRRGPCRCILLVVVLAVCRTTGIGKGLPAGRHVVAMPRSRSLPLAIFN
ncbi:hypothetical protein ACLOJK_008200 [Asimina triloba]